MPAAAPGGTSSTSVTASCPPPTPTSSSGSRSSCSPTEITRSTAQRTTSASWKAHELPDAERPEPGLGCRYVALHHQGADVGDVRRLHGSRRAERGHVRRLLVHQVPPRVRREGPEPRG